MNRPRFVLNAILCILLVILLAPGSPQQTASEFDSLPEHELVVLADVDDPYAGLADEIADQENAMRVYGIEELYDLNVRYVVYIASPDILGEDDLVALSTYFKASGQYPAVGIITGSTLEQARALWQRSDDVQNTSAWVGSAPDFGAKLEEPLLWDWSTQPPTTYPLTEASLTDALMNADYFYWSRHVGSKSWFWNENNGVVEHHRYLANEVPRLKPVVIHTPSCRSFVPWLEESIAMAFVDQGAAAYIGHLYAPISSGYSIGEMGTLPAIHTWPGVPLGAFVQAQNRAEERAVFTQSWQYMLGDPRIAFEHDQPYTIESDTVDGNTRTLTLNWDGDGVLPLLIEGGADYSFVRLITPYETIGAAGDADATYNRNVQSYNWQDDKVLLVLEPWQEFSVELRKNEPLLWRPLTTLRGAFEFTWGFAAPINEVGWVAIGVLVLVVVIRWLRKRNLDGMGQALLIGALWAVIQLVFCYLVAGKEMITSYTLAPTAIELALGFAGTTAATALGLLRLASAKKWHGKLFGLTISLCPTLFLMTVYTGAITLVNISSATKSDLDIWSLNYMPVHLALIVALFELALVLNALPWVRRVVQNQDTPGGE